MPGDDSVLKSRARVGDIKISPKRRLSTFLLRKSVFARRLAIDYSPREKSPVQYLFKSTARDSIQ